MIAQIEERSTVPDVGETRSDPTSFPGWSVFAPLLLVAIAIGFNLFVLRAEVRRVAAPNDVSLHISMVHWAEQRLSHGKLVFDGWYPRVSFGNAQFHHYQSLAPIVGGAIALVFGAARTVAWSNYLLVALWPLCIYWAVRLFGFHRWIAGITALVSPLVSSVTLYGFEHGSFQWRGNGIWTALWGMWLLPLALGFSYRAVTRGSGYALAALFVGLTITAHFLTGYLALIAIPLWVIIKPSALFRRAGRAAVVGVGSAFVAAWVIVPLLADSKFSARTEYMTGTFWDDSYGAKKVLGWLVSGELFDHGRWPVLTVLAAIGLLVCIWRFRRDERARAVLAFTAVSLVLFCGRGPFGFIINRLPGNKDLYLHRYIMGVHLGGIVLAGVGVSFLAQEAYGRVRRWKHVRPSALVAGLLVLGLIVLWPAWRERAHYDNLDAQGINIQRTYDRTDGRDFTTLADQAAAYGGGRIYAGSPANTGQQLAIGSVPTYVYLLDDDVDAVGFDLRTLSLSSDVEVRFNDTNAAQFNLFNVRYVILPAGRQPAVPATPLQSAGRWRLWQVATTGYLQVVDTTPAIVANRTNIGQNTAAFLTSPQLGQGLIPLVAFAGNHSASPTDPTGTPEAGPAGAVNVQYDLPDDGEFGGVVTANRPAVVMLKATYDPRWHVTVDGKPAKTQMLAPSFVGVPVPAGQHRIAFRYVPYGYYWELLTVGGLALIALALVPRFGPRARRWLKHRRTPKRPDSPSSSANAPAGGAPVSPPSRAL
jgi:Bacterial membrane protein YfhO